MPTTDAIKDDMLHAGDQLTAEAFIARWERMPDLRHAELVDGRTYTMPSPVSPRHGGPHADLVGWLHLYAMLTPGVDLTVDTTLILGDRDVAQPDAMLNLPTHAGGRVVTGEKGYLEGVPDLVAEIAYSTERADVSKKFQMYQHHGVGEYVVWRVRRGTVEWWTRIDDALTSITPDEAGVLRSRVWPGLCVEPDMLVNGDRRAVFDLLQRACGDSADHAALVSRLTRDPS